MDDIVKKAIGTLAGLLVATGVFASDYVIGEGDTLSVAVWGEKDYSFTAKVRPDGKITIPATGIDQVYAYPPSLNIENTGDSYAVTGSLASDEILAIEMLGPSEGFSRFPGFRRPAPRVR